MTDKEQRSNAGKPCKKIPVTSTNPCCLRVWLFEDYTQHILWHWYLFGLIHLREVEDWGEAIKHFPEATHEIVVGALDPTTQPVPDDHTTWQVLSPVNVVAQFVCDNDEEAIAVAEALSNRVETHRLLLEPSGIKGAIEAWAAAIRELTGKDARISWRAKPDEAAQS